MERTARAYLKVFRMAPACEKFTSHSWATREISSATISEISFVSSTLVALCETSV
jgi:hypothetical protein